jgi:hypothetical protein
MYVCVCVTCSIYLDDLQHFNDQDLGPISVEDGTMSAICAVRNTPDTESQALVSWEKWSDPWNEWIDMSQVPQELIAAFHEENASMRNVAPAVFNPTDEHFFGKPAGQKNRCMQTTLNNLARAVVPMMTDAAVKILSERFQAVQVITGCDTTTAEYIIQGHATVSIHLVHRFLLNAHAGNKIQRLTAKTSELLRVDLSAMSKSLQWHRLILIDSPTRKGPQRAQRSRSTVQVPPETLF